MTLIAGEALTAPAVTRTGYTCTGWSPALPANVPALNTTYTAQWTVETTDFTYTVSNGKTKITNYNGAGGNVNIPPVLGGCPVTEIGTYAFSNKDLIIRIVIPDSVTSIGDNAFSNCGGLTSVILGQGLKSIGSSAFSGCESLASINLPDGVTSIGYGAFMYCEGLTVIVIPDSVTSLGDAVFTYCEGLTSVTLGNGLKSIGFATFSGCENLTSISIPSSITNFGASVFVYDSKLTAAYFYGNAPTMANNIFTYCAPGFTVYHLPDKTGFTSPTWYDNPTAVFSPVSSITFDANGGTGGTSMTLDYGSPLIPPAVARAGFVFAGWSTMLPATVGACDADYAALWRMVGDINGNDSVTSVDALMALQTSAGVIEATELQRSAADVDQNGSVTSFDALKILQYSAGRIASF